MKIPYKELEIELAMEGILLVEQFYLEEGLNQHGFLSMKLLVKEEKAEELVTMASVQPIVITEKKRTGGRVIFQGKLEQVRLEVEGGLPFLFVEAYSFTKEWERVERSQSFLDGSKTYLEVAKKALSEYQGADIKDEITKGTLIPEMLLQYEESDWVFLRRLASHFGTYLIPDVSADCGKVYFGIPKMDYGMELKQTDYILSKDMGHYVRDLYPWEILPQEASVWSIQTRTFLWMAEELTLNQIGVVVTRVQIGTENGELVYQYELSRREGLHREREKNPRIYGMSIPATVKERSGNRIRVHFDLDPVYECGAKTKYFTYAIESSSFYCMPEEGSRVHIYFPDHEEQSAIAVHAIGSGSSAGENSAGGGGGQNPDNKRFSDPSGSAMDMTPEHLNFTSDSGGSSILIMSGSGTITLNGTDVSMKTQKGLMAGEGEESPVENLMLYGQNKVTLSIGDGGADTITLDTETNLISAFIRQTADAHPVAQPSASEVKSQLTEKDTENRQNMNDAVKNTLVQQKQASKQKILGGIKSILTVVAVTALVVCTGGAAALTVPFVLAAGAKTVFAVADMAEGIDGYQKVDALDTTRPSNFLRDGLFGGNDLLYNLASMGVDIVFDMVSGNAMKNLGALENMDKLFCTGGKVVNMVAKTGVSVVGGMIEDYMVTGKIDPVNTAINFGMGMLKGTVGSGIKGNLVEGLDFDSKAAKKIAGVVIGTAVDSTLDFMVDGLLGREIDPLSTISQNFLANGLAEVFGEPIDAVTGGFLIRSTDAILCDYRESIRVTRSYQSTNQNIGILGKGWRFPYEGRLCLDKNQCHVILDTGHHVMFTWDGEQFQNTTAGCGWFTLKKEEEQYRLKDRKNHKEYWYDKRGQLQSIQDQNGQAMTFTYYKETLEKITTALGYELHLTFREGYLVELTDCVNRTMQYQYENGLLRHVVHLGEGVTHYEYDERGYLVKAIDPSGVAYLTNEYDDKGRVVLQTLANGERYEAEYGEEERRNRIYSSVTNQTMFYEYGRLGEVCSMQYEDGTKTTYEYLETGGIRTKKIDRLGNVTEWKYDKADRMIEEKKPEGLQTTYTYDTEDNLREIQDNLGREWKFAYDKNHNLIKRQEKIGEELGFATTVYEYDRKGRMTIETDALGNETLYRYPETGGSPSVIRYADGSELELEYDSVGRKMAEEDSYGRTEYGYNARNYRTMVRDPLGNETRWMYDGAGRMLVQYSPKAWNRQTGETTFRYDFLDHLVDTIHPDGSHERQFLDGEGNIRKKVHPNAYETAADNGEGITYDYDGDGNQIRIHYPDGGCERFFYDGEGNRIKHVVPEYYETETDHGKGWSYTYDRENRLTEVRTPEGELEAEYGYDLGGNVIWERDAMGQTSYATYDFRGNRLEWLSPVKQTEGEVSYQKVSYSYDAEGNCVTECRHGGYWNPEGEKVEEEGENLTLTFSYDARNRLIKVQDGTGAVIRFRYDGRGNRIYEERKISEEVKQVIHFLYYPNGYLKEKKEELNSGLEPRTGEERYAITKFSYDENGNRTKIITPEGYEIKREYDERDRMVLERMVDSKNGIDRWVKVSYDKAGNVQKVIRQGKGMDAWEVQYDYDLKDRLVKVKDCLGPVFSYAYDKNDRLVREILPQTGEKQQETEHSYGYTYNPRNAVVTKTNGANERIAEYTYQKDGMLASQKNAEGNERFYSYDIRGNEIGMETLRSRAHGKKAQQYVYDARGRMIGILDGNQNRTNYELDGWGRVKGVQSPEGGREQYTYDYAGNRTSTKDANGNKITYRYNSQGKVCEVIDPEGNRETYRYDREGRMVCYTDRMGVTITTTYNLDGNPLVELAEEKEGGRKERREYSYDSMGRCKKSFADGYTYQYVYRPDGKLLEKKSGGKRLLSCTYYSDGSLKDFTDVTGKTVTYGYDWRGNLEEIREETGLVLVQYEHTLGGLLKESTYGNGIKTRYEYDTDGNIRSLVTKTKEGECLCEFQYEYDGNGNRTEKVGVCLFPGEDGLRERVSRYQYDSQNRLVKEEWNGESSSYVYDLNGNRVGYLGIDGTEVYRYNKRNQLVRRELETDTICYTYNLQGNVIEESGNKGKTEYGYSLFHRQNYVKTPEGKTLESFYDGEDLRAGILEDGKKSNFVYYQGELLAETNGENEWVNRMILGYGVAASEVSGKKGYHTYHLDEQKSTAYLVSPEGKIENGYEYGAFGTIRREREEVQNRIWYTGQQYDRTSNQYYLRARFYSPVVGRFLQEDEYRGDGLNLYAYCGNNPVVYYDPSGYASNPVEECDKLGMADPKEQNEGNVEPIVQETKKTTGGQKKGSDTLSENLVQRGITPEQAQMIVTGQGIEKPKPPHKTTPTQHVGGAPHSRDPWTSTSRSSDTAEYYATHDINGNLMSKPNPVVEIDLNRIDPKNIVDVSTPEKAQQLTRPFCQNAAAYDKEVLINGDIPLDAITKIINLEY